MTHDIRPGIRLGIRQVLRPMLLLAAALSGVGSVVGCKDLTSVPGLPAGTPNPVYFDNKVGAVGMRNAAVLQFQEALSSYITAAGLLTDELEDINTGASPGILLTHRGLADPLDERILLETQQFDLNSGKVYITGGATYTALTSARSYANQALGALAAYDTAPADTDSVRVLRGELYALEGYAEIYLADLYCSGVPLNTLDFQRDYTYKPSSTTRQVYLDAIAKFDTALGVAKGHDSVTSLAAIGRGRAELALGNYPVAADDVSTVAPAFVYGLYLAPPLPGFPLHGKSNNNLTDFAMVADREGGNGLPFVSSHDPRVVLDAFPLALSNALGGPFQTVYVPHRYNNNPSAGYPPFTMASGIEAQLIQAEYQLQAVLTAPGPGSFPWLTTLNHLRASIALPDTTDPGTATGRLALLARERAFWLFLDGHRQGDLRRLIRNYNLFQNQVYPTGPYLAPGTGSYGSDVTVPIPSAELTNPHFHGCLDRNA